MLLNVTIMLPMEFGVISVLFVRVCDHTNLCLPVGQFHTALWRLYR